MKIDNLSQVSFDELIECFLASFEGYFVKMPTDAAYYRKQWQIGKIDYKLSYGIFDGDKLVGFVLHCIDNRNNKLVAYNTGTGVIPPYRGKKIVQSIYKYAIDDLRKNGIEKCALEVITENTKAIKAYQSVGFETTKHYKCFAGEIKFIPQVGEKNNIAIKKADYDDINWSEMPNQNTYYWYNHFKIIKNGDYEYYQVWNNESLESFFVINPTNGYLAQFEVLATDEKEPIYQRLFSAIKEVSSFVKINNIDSKYKGKIDFLNSLKIENNINQYQMERFV